MIAGMFLSQFRKRGPWSTICSPFQTTVSHTSHAIQSQYMFSRVSSRPISFLALFLTFCVRVLPWSLKKYYILPFFHKNASLGLKLGLRLALVSTLTLKQHPFETKIDPDPEPAFYWDPESALYYLDILSPTWHWFSFIRDRSVTSPIIYHISENKNNGESAEDEWALISTSEDVVTRTFIL